MSVTDFWATKKASVPPMSPSRTTANPAAEDTPNAVDDGPVVGVALALVHGDDPLAVAPLSAPDGSVYKVEGLGLRDIGNRGLDLIAVVDADDPLVSSTELTVRLHGRPEALAAATCQFDSIENAVRAVITTIQLGIPVARRP